MATLDTKYQGIAAGNANDAMRAQADMLRARTMAQEAYHARMAAQNPQTLALQQEQMRATTGRLRSGSALDNAQAGQAQAQTGVINYAQGMLQDFDSKAGGSSGGSPGAPNPANSSPYAASLGTFGMPSMATPSAPRQTSDVSVDTPNITRAMQGSPGGSSPWALTNAADSHAGTHSVQPTHHDSTPEGRLPPDSPGGLKGMQVFKKGTARVPGKGSPKKDTVPAKLAPGEAVLNASAAEEMGRDNIAAANRRGAMKMGMRPGKGNMPGHYACGTAKVPHYATGTANVPGNSASQNVQAMLRADDAPPMTAPRPGPIPQVAGPDPRMTMWNPTNVPSGPAVQMLSPRPDAPYPGGAPQGRSVDQFMADRHMSFAAPAPLAAPQAPPPVPQVAGPDPRMTMWNPTNVPSGPAVQMLSPYPDAPYPAGAPQGRSMAQIEQQVAQGGQAFAPQRPWDQDFVDAHPQQQPARAPQANLGAERARAGTFGEAFAAARKQAGGGRGMFDWTNPRTGQTGHYRTNIRGER